MSRRTASASQDRYRDKTLALLDEAADEIERLRAEVADRDALIAEALAAAVEVFGEPTAITRESAPTDIRIILSRAPQGAADRLLDKQREADAQKVEVLNADYRDRFGLDGQRGFSVEVAAAIRGGD